MGSEAPKATGDEATFSVIRELGDLPSAAILSEADLARIFKRHPATIKRAVQRDELPPPIKMFGKPCWMVGAIVAHIETRLEAAKKDAERAATRISRHSP